MLPASRATRLGNLFWMPNNCYHPANTPLNPEQWAQTLLRKKAQDAADAAARAAKRAPLVPSLEMI